MPSDLAGLKDMILTHVYSLRKDIRWLERRIESYDEKANFKRLQRQQTFSSEHRVAGANGAEEPRSPDIHLINEDSDDQHASAAKPRRKPAASASRNGTSAVQTDKKLSAVKAAKKDRFVPVMLSSKLITSKGKYSSPPNVDQDSKLRLR